MTEQPLKLRKLWLAIGWLLIGVVIWLSLIPSPPKVPTNDKVAHLVAYGTLRGWIGQLYRRPLMRLSYAFSLVLLGVVLEFTQWMGGHRWFDVNDAVANALGVLLALLTLKLGADRWLYWIERRVMRFSSSHPESRELP